MHQWATEARQCPQEPPEKRSVCTTGKSYLIGAIAQLLNDHCILTGTTGMASFNICGNTLHSALQLPVHQSSQCELQGAALQRLQLRLKDKHYLIIDEMSMMGHKMLTWVDKRLRQASGKLDSLLGGFSVILLCNFGQLPPVGDRPLYAEPSFNELPSTPTISTRYSPQSSF